MNIFFAMIFIALVIFAAVLVINIRKKQCKEAAAEDRFEVQEQRKRIDDKTQEAAKKKEQRRLESVLKKAAVYKQIDQENQLKAQENKQLPKTENIDIEIKDVPKTSKDEEPKKKREIQDRERISPINRGGRPRGSKNTKEIKETTGTIRYSLTPEIICWKKDWSWVIEVDIPEELKNINTTQNNVILEKANTDELHYRLNQIRDVVKVTWVGGEKYIPLIDSGRKYLIFKMRRNWNEPGRLIKYYTEGFYLVIAPIEWTRDEQLSGAALIAPENIQLDGYMAHFFYQEQRGNPSIGFRDENSEQIRIDSVRPHFQLLGNKINDASEEMGHLFGEQPPLIETMYEQGWNNVG